MGSQYSGSEWIARQKYGAQMSPLGGAAADLLGDIYLGIYHLSFAALAKVDWTATELVSVTLYGNMATYDDDLLTKIVTLSHDRMLRVEIQAAAPNYLKLMISQRTTREPGRCWLQMPTLEDHVALLRKAYGTYVDPCWIVCPYCKERNKKENVCVCGKCGRVVLLG